MIVFVIHVKWFTDFRFLRSQALTRGRRPCHGHAPASSSQSAPAALASLPTSMASPPTSTATMPLPQRSLLLLTLAAAVATAPTTLIHRIDHQFRAPGDPLGVFDSKFNDPEALKSFGYNGQAGRYVEAALTFDALPGGPFFPHGSEERAWMDGYADAVRAEMNATAAAGLTVYNHMDFPILPKKVVEALAPKICLNGTARPCIATWGMPLLEVLEVMMTELFTSFPLLDGIIVRTGEHYVVDLPYHCAIGLRQARSDRFVGGGSGGSMSDAILNWFRDSVAEKRGKTVVWRTWDVHPDEAHSNPAIYIKLTENIAPHPRLFFSMKRQGWDYWRYVAFNPTIGIGKHQQIVEASCQRSYEGKGTWPSYIARGVIEGFPEQAENVNYTGGVKGLRDLVGNANVAGLWTWSRGDGNYGPYTKAGELWQTVNCRVLAAWANDTSRTEEELFLETVCELQYKFQLLLEFSNEEITENCP